MKSTIALLFATASLSTAAFAEGDADKGEKNFRKCKSCHMIVSDAGETIVKGGKTGPNLWGVMGKTAGTVEGFNYGDSIVQAGQGGLVWDEASFVAYVADPKQFLVDATGDGSARSKMSFKLKGGAEDIYAYLAQFSAE